MVFVKWIGYTSMWLYSEHLDLISYTETYKEETWALEESRWTFGTRAGDTWILETGVNRKVSNRALSSRVLKFLPQIIFFIPIVYQNNTSLQDNLEVVGNVSLFWESWYFAKWEITYVSKHIFKKCRCLWDIKGH